MNKTELQDVELFNLRADDRVLHANVLIVHEDNPQSPSCTSVHVGHFLRHDGFEALAFPGGNYVRTSPFRMETSRLGKPFADVTHEEVESLNEKYGVETSTPYTIVRRRGVVDLDESLLNADIADYARTYHANRERDIEQAYNAAATRLLEFTTKPKAIATLHFGPDELPLPAESALLSQADERDLDDKAFTLLWQLDCRGRLKRTLDSEGLGSKPAVTLRILEQANGSCCIGVSGREPLALLGNPTELVHLHNVAAQHATAEEVASRAASLIAAHFGLEAIVETVSSSASSLEPCERRER